MANGDLRGINEEKLNALSLNIRDYADKIKNTLNCVEEVMMNTEAYYDCEQANRLREKFRMLQPNFRTIYENISCYADDLVTVKNHYKEQNQAVASRIDAAAINLTTDQRFK